MNTLEKAAREYAGIKPDVFVDSEERYYNGHACENYDTFKAGAEWMQKTMIERACKWLINIDFDDFHFRCTDETFNNDLFVDAFRKAMEE